MRSRRKIALSYYVYPAFYIFSPVVIMISMALMYRAVLKQEKRTQRYGARTLALRRHAAAGPASADEEGRQTKSGVQNLYARMKSWVSSRRSSWMSCGKKENNNIAGRSNDASRQSRAVMHRALCYSLAFIATYLFPIIINIRTFSGSDLDIFGSQWEILNALGRIFFPFQGFFNFIVFIQPKVVHAKKSGTREEKVTWFQAFKTAVKSRGRPKRSERIRARSTQSKKFLFSSF